VKLNKGGSKTREKIWERGALMKTKGGVGAQQHGRGGLKKKKFKKHRKHARQYSTVWFFTRMLFYHCAVIGNQVCDVTLEDPRGEETAHELHIHYKSKIGAS